jgi:hypothetical protein
MNSLDVLVREVLATHAILGKIGFPTDNIFTHVIGPLTEPAILVGKVQVLVAVKQDGREFSFNMGVFNESAKEICDALHRGYSMWNELSQKQRTRIMEGSRTRQQAVNMIAALAAKGFRVSRSIH